MIILIPGLAIRVGAAALSRGAGAAIARWAGGNIVARTVGTVVANKAIDEAKDFLTDRAQWQDSFKADPGAAIADRIKDVAKSSAKSLINPLSWRQDTQAVYASTKELVTGNFKPGEGVGEVFYQELRSGAIASVGKEVERAIKSAAPDPVKFAKEGLNFDLPKAARNYAESVLDRGFQLTQSKQNPPNFPSMENLEGEVRKTAEEVYQELFYARALSEKLVGGSEAELEKLVQSPAESALEEAIEAVENV